MSLLRTFDHVASFRSPLSAQPNGALLPTARFGVRQAGAALAPGARPAAFYLERCSRTLGR